MWDDLFQAPAEQILNEQGVHGVAVPRSHVVTQRRTCRAPRRSQTIVKRLRGATTGGGTSTGSGLHGTGIESVTAQPQDLVLSRVTDNKVVASTSLRSRSPSRTPARTSRRRSRDADDSEAGRADQADADDPGDQPRRTKIVVFRNIDTTGVFGVKTTLKVDVTPVQNEARVDNNRTQYPVIFSLSP